MGEIGACQVRLGPWETLTSPSKTVPRQLSESGLDVLWAL